MLITELTQFQFESLRDAAKSNTQAYMLCKANTVLDPPSQYALWLRNNHETDDLVTLGLLEDVSKDFSNQITENAHMTGRIFRVFKITNTGKTLFAEGHSGGIN